MSSNIKYNEFGEVISVNGITTGQHLGTPMQDAIGTAEENSAYGEETGTVTRCGNVVEDKQPEPQGGGGVTSWNDLTDKPFYEEVKLTEILPETTVEIAEGGTPIATSATIEVGKNYKVVFDGVEYNCIAFELGNPCLGNSVMIGSTIGNSEPFFIGDNKDGSWFVAAQTSGTHTISVAQDDGKLKKIDNKFLPDSIPYAETEVTNALVDTISLAQHTSTDNKGSKWYAINITTINPDVEYKMEVDGVMYDLNIATDNKQLFAELDTVVINGYTITSVQFDIVNGTLWLNDVHGKNVSASTIYLYEVTTIETVHKLDEKYLPYVVIDENVEEDGALSCNVSDINTLFAKLQAFPLAFYRFVTPVGILQQTILGGYGIINDDSGGVAEVIFLDLQGNDAFIFNADGTITRGGK